MSYLMMDPVSCELSHQEKEMLAHPSIGGVILFSRNYEDREQLIALTKSIRQACPRPILISVDHEGGRVQRFRHQFTPIPAMGHLEKAAQGFNMSSAELAMRAAWVMASELRACGVDISFAPVLDLDEESEFIKERAFSSSPDEVIRLARAFCRGQRYAGMATTGKHFPGHGNVSGDSHVDIPRDNREPSTILDHDLRPFKTLIEEQWLDAIMPGHVIYSQFDEQPAGFSEYWLQQQLRQKLGFKGVIFSDDLSMHGASFAGGYLERALHARAAGCDLLLACNDQDATVTLLDGLPQQQSNAAQRMLSKTAALSWPELLANPNYQQWQHELREIEQAFAV
ncbi:beta-N-acetylhexosaminidase [Alginatibacterium sediminis]|uniref:Beta-hexosaminidase n=1 Tax=Alginatibacterium sediminis TaxID=2164068 RepID=A0A420EG42_9ALTE|nr:beta-N-acetylhexosaminidase [Alginatibacterium sediminis]RKF19536.1 beta-N-acetylhexosaminidase [Alginatibacterium sediminis]